MARENRTTNNIDFQLTNQQSYVTWEWKRGLRTHPCDEPVFRVRVEEVWSPVLTLWGLFLRKSGILVHRELPRPMLLNFQTSLWGISVLKGEQKSTNSIIHPVTLDEGCVTVRCESCVERCYNSILCGPVYPVCKLGHPSLEEQDRCEPPHCVGQNEQRIGSGCPVKCCL